MAENLPLGGQVEQGHIWLRYTTQYSQHGRTHTFEIGIPVPLGASAEARERLIEEAEAGMQQLSTHVENRIAGLLQRNQRANAPVIAIPAATPAPATIQAQTPASAPASSTPAISRQTSQPVQAPKATPTAPTVQASTKTAPASRPTGGGASASGQNQQNEVALRAQFIQQVKETLGLTPPQIMERLKVKSLSGFDFQEAFERLKQMSAQEQGAEKASTSASASSPARPARTEASSQGRAATSAQKYQSGASKAAPRSRPQPETQTVAEPRAPLRFEEEEDLPDLEDIDFELEEEEEEELEPFMTELAGEGKERARGRIERLRAINSSGKASADRMRVLKNITEGQISSEQVRQLLREIWGPSALKTPRSEQVEALISWAKEDHFIEEVEAVLSLIEEEGLHASSDR